MFKLAPRASAADARAALERTLGDYAARYDVTAATEFGTASAALRADALKLHVDDARVLLLLIAASARRVACALGTDAGSASQLKNLYVFKLAPRASAADARAALERTLGDYAARYDVTAAATAFGTASSTLRAGEPKLHVDDARALLSLIAASARHVACAHGTDAGLASRLARLYIPAVSSGADAERVLRDVLTAPGAGRYTVAAPARPGDTATATLRDDAATLDVDSSRALLDRIAGSDGRVACADARRDAAAEKLYIYGGAVTETAAREVLSRTIGADNAGKYFIDPEPARFRCVAILLAGVQLPPEAVAALAQRVQQSGGVVKLGAFTDLQDARWAAAPGGGGRSGKSVEVAAEAIAAAPNLEAIAAAPNPLLPPRQFPSRW